MLLPLLPSLCEQATAAPAASQERVYCRRRDMPGRANAMLGKAKRKGLSIRKRTGLCAVIQSST